MQKKILYTGFGPFSDITSNPSSYAAEYLSSFPGVRSLVLPVSYKRCFAELLPVIGEFKPDAIVLSGVAGMRTRISVERCAYNMQHASIPDVDGVLLSGSPIHEGAPAVLCTSLDVNSIACALNNAGLPAYVSDDPGRYICNCIYYNTLLNSGIPAVFIHYPGDNSMPLSDVLKAAETVIKSV